MPIQTRADFELIQNELRAELAKPEAEQDMDFMQAAVAQLREAEPRIGPRVQGAASEAIQAGALRGTEDPVQPKRVMLPNQGFPVEVGAGEQLGTRALIEGAQQRFRELGDFFRRLGMSDEEAASAAEQQAQREAQADVRLEEAARQAGVDPASLELPKTVGGLVPDAAAAAVPGALPLRTGGGALARIAAETATGGVLGGASVELDKDLTFLNTGLPALGGGILGAVAEIPQLGRNIIFSESRAALNSDAARRGQEVADITGIDLSIGEMSGNRAASMAEGATEGIAGGPRDQFLNRRQEQIQLSFEQLDEQLNPSRLSTGTIISQTKDALDRRVGELREIAGSRFRARLAPGAQATGATIDDAGRIIGGERIVPVDNVVTELRRQAELAGEVLSGSSEAARRSLIAEADRLEALNERGGLTFGELQRALSEFTNPTRGPVKDAMRAADNLDDKLVLRALFRDMEAAENMQLRTRPITPQTSSGTDVAPAQGGTGVGQPRADRGTTIEGTAEERLNNPEAAQAVVDSLRAARAGYARDFEAVKRLEGTATERLLGKVGDPADEEFAARLMSLPKQEFRQLMQTVDRYNPGASRALRSRMLFEMIDKHTMADAARSSAGELAGRVDIPALIAEFNRMPFEKLSTFIDYGLPAAEASRLRAGLLAVQKIAEGSLTNSSTRNLVRKIEDFAINAASQDAGFLSRLAAGNLSPGFIEKVLFTKRGQRSLARLGDPKLAGPEFAQTMNFLAAAMREDDERTAQIKEQLRAQQDQQAQQLGRTLAQPF